MCHELRQPRFKFAAVYNIIRYGGVETIKPYVDEFIQFAKEHPELTFLVTRIGCGIAGY